jgi:vacuolar protein sorting-associated protein 45
MNVIKAVYDYVTNMIKVPGMKVLIMDEETVTFVSAVYTYSKILQKEVHLLEMLSNAKRECLPQLKAICFVRPTKENIDLLIEELRHPCYAEYYLFFSNIIDDNSLERLAHSVMSERVISVFEYFADYIPINPDLFTLNMTDYCYMDQVESWDRKKLERTHDSLIAVLLSLQKRPIIRYDQKSSLATRLAQKIHVRKRD